MRCSHDETLPIIFHVNVPSGYSAKLSFPSPIMYRPILSVASALALELKACLKRLFWLVSIPVVTISLFQLISRNDPPAPQIPPDSHSPSDLPYRSPPRSIYDNYRTSNSSKYSTTNQVPSPYSHHRRTSTPYAIYTPLAPCDAPVAKSVKYTQPLRPATALATEVTYPPNHESFALEHQCQCHMFSYESGETIARDADMFVKDLALNTNPLGAHPTLPLELESKRPASRQRHHLHKVPKLDLHGYRVKEAIPLSRRAIEDARKRGHSQIRLIVGKGLHSEGKIARIKPAITRWLRRNNLVSDVDPQNAGVLIVQLA